MVKQTPTLLKGKRKAASLIEITTPPDVITESLNVTDFDASFVSICCLLQTESEASVKLVVESQILSKMLERARTGIPRHLEEHTLGAFWSALTWIPAEVVNSLIDQGLVDLCQSVVDRSTSATIPSRIADRASEIALEVLRDLVQLDSKVGARLLEHIEQYVAKMVSLPTEYPSMVIKRALARLVFTLVEHSPESFVAGLPQSRLSLDSMRALFSMCNGEDLEASCYICLSGLVLEGKFGSSVCPTSSNIRIDFIATTQALIEEACLLSGETTDEETLRLSLWRSRIRGISTFLEHVAEVVEESVSDGVERTDNIEERKFFSAKPNGKTNIEFQLVDKLVNVEKLEESVTRLVSGCCVEDRDLENVFQLVGYLIRIKKIVSFRFEGIFDNSAIFFAVKVLSNIAEKGCDLRLASCAVSDSLDLVSTCLLSIVSGKNESACELIQPSNAVSFVNSVLKKIIQDCLQSEETSGEELSEIPSCVFEIVQLLSILLEKELACRESLAILLIESLTALSEGNMSESLVCSLMEAMFVVFSESETDSFLFSIDWVSKVSNIAIFLNSRMKRLKAAKNPRTIYLEGTLENIKAFVQYKRQSFVS